MGLAATRSGARSPGRSRAPLRVAANQGADTGWGAGASFLGDRSRGTTYRARNVTHTGDGTVATVPVGVRAPLVSSILKTTTVSESWLAANRNLPVGSMPKLRGVLPPVRSLPAAVSLPD